VDFAPQREARPITAFFLSIVETAVMRGMEPLRIIQDSFDGKRGLFKE
jgi:hypothetical protein